MNRKQKVSAGGLAVSAALFAAAFSLPGGGAGPASGVKLGERGAGADAAASDSDDVVSGQVAGVSALERAMPRRDWVATPDALDRRVRPLPRAGAIAVGDTSTPHTGEAGLIPASDDSRGGDSPHGISVAVPRRVTVVPPRYQPGTTPGVTAPKYEPGVAPSVTVEDDRVVVELGDAGSVSQPSVRPGRPGRLTPPQVIIE